MKPQSKALVLVLARLGLFILLLVAARALGVDPAQPGPEAFALVLTFGAASAAILVLWGIRRWGHTSLEELGWRTWRPGRDTLLGGAAAAVCIAVVVLEGSLRASVGLGAWAREHLGATLRERALFALIGLEAGFNEESLFRGYLQAVLASKGRWLAIVLSALVFAAYHLSFRPLPFLNRFVFGLLWGTLREKTGSLLPSGLAHALFWACVGLS